MEDKIMAFCNMCGKELKEGEVCSCQSQGYIGPNVQNTPGYNYNQQTGYNANGNGAPNYNNNPVNNAWVNNSKEIANGILSQILSLIKEPVTYGKEYVLNGNVLTAVVLIVLQGLFCALFAVFNCLKVQSLIETAISKEFNGMEALVAASAVKLPIVSGFFLTLILSVVLTVILAGLMFGANKLAKNNITFVNALLHVSLRSMVTVFITAVACIVLFINAFAAIGIFYLGGILGFIFMFMTAPTDENANKNILFFTVFAACIIFAMIFYFVISHCWTIYVPSTIKTQLDMVLKELKGFNLEKLF